MPPVLKQLRHVLYFCNGEACLQKNGDTLTVWMRERLRDAGLAKQVHTVRTLCTGFCDHAPVWVVQPDLVWYEKVEMNLGEQILQCHLKGGKPLSNKRIE